MTLNLRHFSCAEYTQIAVGRGTRIIINDDLQSAPPPEMQTHLVLEWAENNNEDVILEMMKEQGIIVSTAYMDDIEIDVSDDNLHSPLLLIDNNDNNNNQLVVIDTKSTCDDASDVNSGVTNKKRKVSGDEEDIGNSEDVGAYESSEFTSVAIETALELHEPMRFVTYLQCSSGAFACNSCSYRCNRKMILKLHQALSCPI
jgi:hypothetical protein